MYPNMRVSSLPGLPHSIPGYAPNTGCSTITLFPRRPISLLDEYRAALEDAGGQNAPDAAHGELVDLMGGCGGSSQLVEDVERYFASIGLPYAHAKAAGWVSSGGGKLLVPATGPYGQVIAVRALDVVSSWDELVMVPPEGFGRPEVDRSRPDFSVQRRTYPVSPRPLRQQLHVGQLRPYGRPFSAQHRHQRHVLDGATRDARVGRRPVGARRSRGHQDEARREGHARDRRSRTPGDAAAARDPQRPVQARVGSLRGTHRAIVLRVDYGCKGETAFLSAAIRLPGA